MAETLPLLFIEKAKAHPSFAMYHSKHGGSSFKPTSYAEQLADVSTLASGLLDLGLARGEHVGLIADNRREWLMTDLAILGLGAADVPRGCDATEQEARYILSHAECRVSFFENERQFAKVVSDREGVPMLAHAILFDPAKGETVEAAAKSGIAVHSLAAIMVRGLHRSGGNTDEYEREAAKGRRDELATIIYTSGTTGTPKGVMLSHGAFLHQGESFPEILAVGPELIWLSVLPVWHALERAVEYAIIATSSSLAYSRPVGSIMLADFQAVRPHWMVSVPRIWESVLDGIYKNIRQKGGVTKALFDFFVGVSKYYAYYRNMLLGRLPNFGNRSVVFDSILPLIPIAVLAPLRGLGELLVFGKIKAKLGGRFQCGISGGGAMPPVADLFFDAIGIRIVEGYGLTETAPVLSVRHSRRPVMGTVGPALPATEFRVVDERGSPLPYGNKGLVMARGPQVMQGYYKRQDLTDKVLSKDGWLDTGDLGMLTRHGELKLTGRLKDTIVLRGGENIEPVPIEQKLGESMYVSRAVILGQDMRYLAALIIPNQETISAWARENNVPGTDYEETLKQPEIRELIDYEIAGLVNSKNGFKAFERIFRFDLLPLPFETGRELSAKQEVKRHSVNEIYAERIAKLFAD